VSVDNRTVACELVAFSVRVHARISIYRFRRKTEIARYVRARARTVVARGWLQALHFCYGIGAFVSPMIAEPFLLNEDCSPFVDNDTSGSLSAAEDLGLLAGPGTIRLNDTAMQLTPADTLAEAQQMTRVRYAFWIMAAVQVRSPPDVCCLGVFFRTRKRTK